MIGFAIVITALVCLGIGYFLGRRSGIEAEARRHLRD
jgi:hypothetical protein